jgi:hypothetical protein
LEIEYDFTVDDAQAYSEYYLNNSPAFKKQLASTSRKFLYIPLVFVIGAVLFSFGKDYTIPIIFLVFAAVLGGAYFFMPGILRKRLLKTARDQHAQHLPARKRKQKITVTPDKITQTTSESTQTFQWNTVEDVITWQQYLFILVRNTGAISIPQSAFANPADFEKFTTEVKSNYRKG